MFRLKMLATLMLLPSLFSCHKKSDDPRKAPQPQGSLKESDAQSPSRGMLVEVKSLAQFSKEDLDAKFASIGISAVNGVQVYKLTYLTEVPSTPPALHKASGIVVVPDNGAKRHPWMSLQHGTITGQVEAPSVSYGDGLLEGSQGFLTVVQDYIGFGDASDLFHPYMIERSYVSTGIDMLRAASAFAEGVDLKLGPLFLRGYSEGGYATMVLQKAIETEFTDEFQVAASAPAAGPYDLVVTSRVLASRPTVNPVNLPFVLLSYNRWFGEDRWDLSKMLKLEISRAYELFGGSYRTEELFAILPWETTQLFHADLVADVISPEPSTHEGKTLRTWLSEQSLTNKGWIPSTPTRLYHCIDDTAVPVEATESAYASFKGLSDAAPVEMVLIESPDPSKPYDHMSCPGFYSSLGWFSEILRSTIL